MVDVRYLELAGLGKNHWLRYLAGILLIALMWQVVGAIPMVGLMFVLESDGDPATGFYPDTMRFEGVDPVISYLVLSFSFIAMLAGVYLTVRFLHHRGLLSLITPAAGMSWKRALQGFGVYFALMAVLTLVGVLLSPDNYKFTFQAREFFLFLPFALVLTPLQASAEELLFRGYIMQGVGRLVSNRLTVALASAVLFMLPHLLNPEAHLDPVLMPLTYLSMGLFMALITLRDNSLELAMGAHSANNLFTFLFANYEGSVMASPSVLTEAAPDPLTGLISFIVVGSVFYWIVFRWQPLGLARAEGAG
jgi:hypothetical protein